MRKSGCKKTLDQSLLEWKRRVLHANDPDIHYTLTGIKKLHLFRIHIFKFSTPANVTQKI